MGKWCLHASLFLGNKDMFKNYKRFDFWHVQTADIGSTKPWKNNCSLIWKLFKFLMTLLAGLFEMRGCWHIGLRRAIVALWATCFVTFEYRKLFPSFSYAKPARQKYIWSFWDTPTCLLNTHLIIITSGRILSYYEELQDTVFFGLKPLTNLRFSIVSKAKSFCYTY